MVSLTPLRNQNPAMPGGAPVDRCAVAGWLARVPGLKLDGQSEPSPDEVARRLGEFWLCDESILYIGKAGVSLRDRVGAYYRTPLGNRSPHKGGHWIKTLSILRETFVHYAETPRPEESECHLLRVFTSRVTTKAKGHLRDPDRPFPFANLEFPKGNRKKHGLTEPTR